MHLRVVFKADLTGGLMQIEDAAQFSDHRFVLGLAFGGVIYLGYEQQWFGLGTNVDLLVTEPVQRGGC